MHPYLQIAIKAALEAGKEILAVYDTDFSVQLKEDHSPLTLADERSNRVINKHLEATKIPIISEENKQIAFNDRKDWEKCWIVDPLDGTKEFVKRNGEFTVNIALVERGTPVLGVIYVPVIETLYYGTKDLGKSFKAIVDQPNIDLVSSKAEAIHPANLQEPYKIVGSRSHLNEDTQNFIKKIEKQHPVELVSKGSSLKFCLVAEGLAHIYPRFAPTMEWDTAAGQAICEAVGISVIDQQTQKPLRYNKENLLNPHFFGNTTVMARYQHESHIRSILKGISWRIVATTDTILVVLFVTCLAGHCSLENALKIGAAEFLLKLFVYYLHERAWQYVGKRPQTSVRQTLYKSLSWRVVATSTTFVISGIVLESYDEIALFIALTELFTKFALYYFHERLWLRLPLGRIRNFVKRLISK